MGDLSQAYPGWVELAARSGLRAFLDPFYASARSTIRGTHLLDYVWDEKGGERVLMEALALLDTFAAHLVYPGQIDTCTESLLRDSAAAAASVECR